MNITYGAGAMLGAALGGVMADYLGWRWEFGVQVPVIVASLIVAVMTIPDDLGLHGKEQQNVWEAMKKFDYAGSFLMSTSITFLILGLVRSPSSRFNITCIASADLWNQSRALEETSCHVRSHPQHVFCRELTQPTRVSPLCPRLPCHLRGLLPSLPLR